MTIISWIKHGKFQGKWDFCIFLMYENESLLSFVWPNKHEQFQKEILSFCFTDRRMNTLTNIILLVAVTLWNHVHTLQSHLWRWENQHNLIFLSSAIAKHRLTYLPTIFGKHKFTSISATFGKHKLAYISGIFGKHKLIGFSVTFDLPCPSYNIFNSCLLEQKSMTPTSNNCCISKGP